MPRSVSYGIGQASRKADAVFQQSTVHNPLGSKRSILANEVVVRYAVSWVLVFVTTDVEKAN